MNVTELARRAGTAASAVRWYEAVGVLPPAPRGTNGYRRYDETDLARVRLVVSLRRLGLSPDEAGRVAGQCVERGTVDPDLLPLLVRQREEIGRRRSELDRLEAELADLEETIVAAGRAAHREGTMPETPIRVLFVCTGNSARSQLAEAVLGRIGGPAFHVASAGTDPAGVNPYTVRVLAEDGIDWTAARSKHVAEFLDEPWDYVITVCDRARQACPVFPGEHDSLHWGLEDPVGVTGSDDERLSAFRRTVAELTQRIRPFVEVARRMPRTTVGASERR